MKNTDYKALLESLSAEASRIEIRGVPVQVRSCSDRTPGQMDARTARVALTSREEFRAEKQTFDTELHSNEDKLFGPERPEFSADPVTAMRFQFGWRSTDLSSGITVRRLGLETEYGAYSVWQYKPEHVRQGRPCLVFIHGGGFVAGDTSTVENQCKLLAQLADAVVLSVDYPLAPEHPYPAGFEACYNTIIWAHENASKLGIDKQKIGVAGDSAGGNLSLVCALRDRDEGANMLHYQALIYPLLSRAFSQQDQYYYWSEEQYENPGNDAIIADQIRTIGRMAHENCAWYVPKTEDRFKSYISPITAPCKGLPPTLIMTAEYDYLRAECDAYLHLLTAAGVPVRAIRYGGIFHGTFDRLGYAPQVEDMILEIAADLKSL